MITTALASLLLAPQTGLLLTSAQGQRVNPFTDGKRTTVLFFLTEECPISRKYSPEMGRIAREYGTAKFRFYAVHVDPATTPARAQTHAKAFRLPFAALLDPYHKAATVAGAKVVPTAAVYDAKGRLRYLGRIDDRFPALGVMRHKAKREDLRMALDDLISGGPVEKPRTDAVGCTLPPPKTK
ncbi:MAG: redoxin domain-containing protein [Fimbriimonas sp.]